MSWSSPLNPRPVALHPSHWEPVIFDCVYHFALYELQATLKVPELDDAADLLAVMVEGKRLKDISDLPLDMAV